METFTELFKTILAEDKGKSRVAAREVRKLTYGSRSGKNEFKIIQGIIEAAPLMCARISEDWRRENFVLAISVIYFLHDREDQPDFLFPWFFQLLQNKNGNIRHVAVRMIEHELGSLTCHIRFPEKELGFSKLSPEIADQVLYDLRMNLENLERSSWNREYKKLNILTNFQVEFINLFNILYLAWTIIMVKCHNRQLNHTKRFLSAKKRLNKNLWRCLKRPAAILL